MMGTSFCALKLAFRIFPYHGCMQGSNHILTLFMQGFLAAVVPVGGPPSPCNSFVFDVRGLTFSTKLLCDKINILQQEKLGSS